MIAAIVKQQQVVTGNYVKKSGTAERRRLAGAETIVVRLRRRVDYSIVKDLRRGERLIREEPRAQMNCLFVDQCRSAYRGASRLVTATGASGEKAPLLNSIQYGKKRFGSFRIIFMGIQPVTGLCREPGSEPACR
jgi:hypothetical protein